MATGLRACRPGGGRVFELCRQRRPCAADLPVVAGQTALGEAAGRTEMFRRLTTAAGLEVRSAVCVLCCAVLCCAVLCCVFLCVVCCV